MKADVDYTTVCNNKSISYINLPASFDIETTSFYVDGEKRALMYEWTLCVDGNVIIGRTWEEFMSLYTELVTIFKTSLINRLVIYVHNLGFEFQFLRKHLEWATVFAMDIRKPLYALTTDGVEFRCSYLLSGYKLATVGDKLRKYPVRKMVGDLDYRQIRHSKTLMSDEEFGYCINDALIVNNYIKEQIEKDGDITRIPLTKTGYVRRYCRNNCLYTSKSHKQGGWKFIQYRMLMNSLTLDADEYKQLKRAFHGGFTHANGFYAQTTVQNVASYDFTSSYPAVMVSEQFPMSKGVKIDIQTPEEFYHNLDCYCCLFDITFINLRPLVLTEHPLSVSKCTGLYKHVEDNGRIVEAEELTTTMTEQDFFIVQQFYTWDEFAIGDFRRYRRAYLPRDFVMSILKLYWDKTTLKGVEGREDEYLNSKELLNSCYGMAVTDICRDVIDYADDWMIGKGDVVKDIAVYNRSVNRFLFYAWGVWVTAYAGRNLFTGIYEAGADYVYSDTDSVKLRNAENHAGYFEQYNKMIEDKLIKAMDYHGFDRNLIRPKTIKGEEKILGVWEYEGTYSRFKTLGAKRYMTEKDGQISITVSGLNKKATVPYLIKEYGDDVFEKFDDDLYIPPEYTGKLTHTYIDDEQSGFVTDYDGVTAEYTELSAVHLEPAEYEMSLSSRYLDYLMGIREFNK